MNRIILTALAAIIIALVVDRTPVYCQPTRQELTAAINDVTTLDPEIEKYLPRWKILEADLKLKLAEFFKMSGVPVSEQDSMIVTATFPDPKDESQSLLSIRVGNLPAASISGTQNIKTALGEKTYQEILRRDYRHDVIEPAIPVTQSSRSRIPNVLEPTNAKQFIAISAFRQVVQLGSSGARIEHVIGDDEIGYPFWSAGQAKAFVHYPIIPLKDPELRANGVPDIFTIQLGGVYRLKIGDQYSGDLANIVQPRLLDGSPGKALAHIEYRLPQVNDIGFFVHAELPFDKLSGVTEVNPLTVAYQPSTNLRAGRFSDEPDSVLSAYFLRNIAQGGIFWENWLNDYEHFFRISLGISYQDISHAALVTSSDPVELYDADKYGLDRQEIANQVVGVVHRDLIHPTEFEDWIFAKVEYLNQSGFPFGFSAQLANRNLLISGFVPVLRNWLFLEAKLSTPVLRDQAAPWEQSPFVMISPVLRFKID